MLSRKASKSILVSVLFLILGISSRFAGLFWGDGHFFHPDENNMAISVANMSSDLNPHFFAYGQFPLYLAYFVIKILKIPQNMLTATYVLRVFSALYSLATLVVLYQISKFFFKPKQTLIYLLLILFSPGLIQISHFGTTESLLVLVFCLQIYLSLLYLKKPQRVIFLLSILISSIGLATKISSIIFLGPFLITLLLTSKKLINFVIKISLYLIAILFLSGLLSPYNIINWPDFLSSIKYETAVATGSIEVFYTRQFKNSIPYIFQFIKIFPFALGIPVLFFSIPALFQLPKTITKKNRSAYLIILLPCLIYFLYFGQVYTKWTRFMSPLFFIFPFLAVNTITRLKPNIKKLSIVFSLIPGLLTLSIYFRNDIRSSFSDWFIKNIPRQSVILSEAGNVVNLPLNTHHLVTNFDFYNLDQDSQLQSDLPSYISNSDYIITPSRRIFKNQTNKNYPYSQIYYQNLEAGNLGFYPVNTFYGLPRILNHENAEETWSVFDHPTIRIYKKELNYDLEYYQRLFNVQK